MALSPRLPCGARRHGPPATTPVLGPQACPPRPRLPCGGPEATLPATTSMQGLLAWPSLPQPFLRRATRAGTHHPTKVVPQRRLGALERGLRRGRALTGVLCTQGCTGAGVFAWDAGPCTPLSEAASDSVVPGAAHRTRRPLGQAQRLGGCAHTGALCHRGCTGAGVVARDAAPCTPRDRQPSDPPWLLPAGPSAPVHRAPRTPNYVATAPGGNDPRGVKP